tara:strand:+ start:458 stop:1057 length:600 start_codon:yes stop_codon:yes gene_type:complete
MNNIVKWILFFIISVSCVVIIVVNAHYSANRMMSQQHITENFGNQTTIPNETPLDYELVTDYLKSPSNITDDDREKYEELINNTDTDLFNDNTKQNIYGDNIIITDLKYFNNASNILLYHYYNENSSGSSDYEIPAESMYNNLSTGSNGYNAYTTTTNKPFTQEYFKSNLTNETTIDDFNKFNNVTNIITGHDQLQDSA